MPDQDPRSRVLHDLIWVVASSALLMAVLVGFDFIDHFYAFTRAHEEWELDELLTLLFALPLPLAWYAWRRLRDALRQLDVRRLAEQALRERERQYRSLFGNIGDGILLADLEELQVLQANPALGHMLAYPPAELAGRAITELLPEEGRSRVLEGLQAMARREIALLPEVPLLRRGGSLFHADLHAFVSRYQDRDCLCVSIRDVSERRHLVRDLERLNRRLEQRVAEAVAEVRERDRLLFHQARYAQMGEMLSMIAHQWRQPLTALNTAGIELAVKSSLAPPAREDVERFTRYLEKQVQGMSATIDDFMEFFRPDQRREPFSLTEAVGEVVQLMGPQLRNRGVELRVAVPEEPRLVGHRRLLEQVLINLIANARDAGEGKLCERRIELTAQADTDGERMTIVVEDHAGGIPDEIRERIFDPYFTTKEPGKGTGIGLYMSRTLVERDFGGRLTAENGIDGARLILSLPLFSPGNS